jgi:hypothetical protein
MKNPLLRRMLMKSYSKVLLITALLSCVSVQAEGFKESNDQGPNVTRVLKKSVHAPLRYLNRVVPAGIFLYLSTKIVDGTPLRKVAEAIDGISILKRIESIIPHAAENNMLKNMTTVALGALGIASADALLKQKDVRGLMKKHCPAVATLLDKILDCGGIMAE